MIASSAAADATPSKSALRHRPFCLLWCASIVSSTGTWMQTIAVPYVLFDLTSSTTWVGAYAFAALLPGIVATPIGGALADRFSRRRVVLIGQSIMGLLAGALTTAWAVEWRQPALILVLGALVTIFGSASNAGFHALISDVVPRELVTSAVSLNSAQVSIGKTVGPAIGGILIAGPGPEWAFAGNAISFVGILAVLATARVQRHETTPDSTNLVRRIAEGAHHVWHDRGMRIALILATSITALANTLLNLVTPYAEVVLGGGPRLIGGLVGLYGLGSVVSAAAIPRLVVPGRRHAVICGATATLGVLTTAAGLAPGPTWALVAFFVMGGVYLVAMSPIIATFHLRADPQRRARAISVFLVSFTSSIGVSALIQSVIGDVVGLRWPITTAGLVLTAIALVVRHTVDPRTLEAPEAPPSIAGSDGRSPRVATRSAIAEG